MWISETYRSDFTQQNILFRKLSFDIIRTVLHVYASFRLRFFRSVFESFRPISDALVCFRTLSSDFGHFRRIFVDSSWLGTFFSFRTFSSEESFLTKWYLITRSQNVLPSSAPRLFNPFVKLAALLWEDKDRIFTTPYLVNKQIRVIMSITENESSVIAVEWIENRSPSIFNAVKIEGQDTRKNLMPSIFINW